MTWTGTIGNLSFWQGNEIFMLFTMFTKDMVTYKPTMQ